MSGPTDPFDEVERLFDQLTDFGATIDSEVPVDVVDEDSAQASYDEGVLTVRLDKQTATDHGTDIPVN